MSKIDLVPPFDRASVRALAERFSAESQRALDRGENHYQTSLDQQDRIDAFAATLSDEDAVRFLNLYAEELNALTSRLVDRTAEIEAENQALAIPRAIGSVVTAAGILWLLYALISLW